MPALQKAMLRNPEIILETVGFVISGVEIDLNNFALEISKNLIGISNQLVVSNQNVSTYLFLANLYSKDDKARNEAANACTGLASKISDKEVLEEILRNCFAVFHGSEGKLSVVDHKLSVLQVKSI